MSDSDFISAPQRRRPKSLNLFHVQIFRCKLSIINCLTFNFEPFIDRLKLDIKLEIFKRKLIFSRCSLMGSRYPSFRLEESTEPNLVMIQGRWIDLRKLLDSSYEIYNPLSHGEMRTEFVFFPLIWNQLLSQRITERSIVCLKRLYDLTKKQIL